MLVDDAVMMMSVTMMTSVHRAEGTLTTMVMMSVIKVSMNVSKCGVSVNVSCVCDALGCVCEYGS